MEVKIGKTKLVLIQGDITQQDTEAIVNAANPTLLGGGGVDGAIHRAGGPDILKECKQIRKTLYKNGLPTGDAVITSGGNLKARYVIHTVGPVWHGGNSNEEELLKNAYFNSLQLAVKHNITSIAFPSISTGAYRFPVEKAAIIALSTIKEFIKNQKHSLTEIRLVLFTLHDFEIYKNALNSISVEN